MNKPKKLAAMDLLLKSDILKPAISQNSALSRSPLANLRNGAPVEISPKSCRPWKLADRPTGETAHKAELIKSFQKDGVGQIQPIVVRSVKDPDAPEIAYEVICGRVRWMAALELGVPVQAIVRELDDRDAYLVMSAENRQRKNISDYAKAKSYQKALAFGLFATAQEFAEAEGISKSSLSQYLGFAELPEEIAERFANIAKIPYRLGYEISKACKSLGNDAVAALIPQIESGELSRSAIQQMQAQIVRALPPTTVATGQAAPPIDPKPADVLSRIPCEREAPIPEPAAKPAPTESVPETAKPLETETSVENLDDLWGNLPEAAPPTAPGDGAEPPLLAAASSPLEIPFQAEPADAQTEVQLKKSFVSSKGRRLFTYNQASRGWLIRIAPEVSMRMDEALMLEFGKLLETYLDGVRKQ